MNINLKIVVLGMACLLLAGCGESDEEKVLSQAQSGDGWVKQKIPDCAKRDPLTKKYSNGKGCTWEERREFELQRKF